MKSAIFIRDVDGLGPNPYYKWEDSGTGSPVPSAGTAIEVPKVGVNTLILYAQDGSCTRRITVIGSNPVIAAMDAACDTTDPTKAKLTVRASGGANGYEIKVGGGEWQTITGDTIVIDVTGIKGSFVYVTVKAKPSNYTQPNFINSQEVLSKGIGIAIPICNPESCAVSATVEATLIDESTDVVWDFVPGSARKKAQATGYTLVSAAPVKVLDPEYFWSIVLDESSVMLRNFRLTFCTSDNQLISSRDVNNLTPTGWTGDRYLLFNPVNEGITTVSNYKVIVTTYHNGVEIKQTHSFAIAAEDLPPTPYTFTTFISAPIADTCTYKLLIYESSKGARSFKVRVYEGPNDTGTLVHDETFLINTDEEDSVIEFLLSDFGIDTIGAYTIRVDETVLVATSKLSRTFNQQELDCEQPEEYSFSITSINLKPNNQTNRWEIVLNESEQGVRTFLVDIFKGSGTSGTPITTPAPYTITGLNTAGYPTIDFTPSSDDPWRIFSNGPGTYTFRVKVLLNGNVYEDTYEVVFTNEDLGISVEDTCGCGELSPLSVESLAHLGQSNFRISFNGCDVSMVNLQLRRASDGAIVQSKLNHPVSSDTFDFAFPEAMISGTYYVRMIGVNCSGAANSENVVVSIGGGGNPNPPGDVIEPEILNTHRTEIVWNSSTNTYSDVQPNELNINGGLHHAFYFVNDAVMVDGSGLPLPFTNITLPPNSLLMVRKLMVRKSTYPNYNVALEWMHQTDTTYNGGPNIAYNSTVNIRTRNASAAPTGDILNDAFEGVWLEELKAENTTFTGSGTSAVLSACNMRTAIDNVYAIGGRSLMMTVKWNEYEPTLGVLDPTRMNRLFAFLNYVRSKQMVVLLKTHMSIGNVTDSYPHLYSVASQGVRVNSSTVFDHPFDVPMAFSSPSISNMDRYWNLIGTAIQSYSSMVFVGATVTPTEEMQYMKEALTDYGAAEEAEWDTFQMAKFGENLGNQPSSYSGTIGQRWYAFKGSQLVKFCKRWGAIFKAKGFKTFMDVGSSVNQYTIGGHQGILGVALKPEIDFLKENPAYEEVYNIAMIASIQTTYNKDWSCVELTYDSSDSVEGNAIRMRDQIIIAKEGGVRIINFSFARAFHDTGSNNYKAIARCMELLANWKGKRRAFATNCTTLTFNMTDAIAGPGFMNAKNTTYNASLASCGTTGRPRVNIVNNIS